jgi:LPXTG-motif cell wall-anchored protein
MKRFSKVAFLLCLPVLALLVMPGVIRAQSSPQQITLTLTEFSITPSSFTATQGQPVHFTLVNTGKFPHNVTFMMGTEMVTLEAQPLKSGETATADFTFDQAGTWDMHCPVDSHAQRGMVGQVIVNAAVAPGMPSTGQALDQLPMMVGGLAAILLVTGGLVVRRRKAARVRARE